MNPSLQKKSLSIGVATIEYVISGTGTPVIVLVNGAGGPIEGWHRVASGLEALGTVFAYNRPGIGKRSKPTESQTGSVMLETLRALLLKVGLPPPYVLVGHSFGGLIVNLFARRYPDEVGGVVFLEATAPEDIAVMAAHESAVQKMLRKALDLVLGASTFGETAHVRQTVEQISRSPAFPDIPVIVLTGAKPAMKWLTPTAALAARAEHQRGLAALSAQGRQVSAVNSGHFPQFSEPDLVIQVVREVVQAMLKAQAAA